MNSPLKHPCFRNQERLHSPLLQIIQLSYLLRFWRWLRDNLYRSMVRVLFLIICELYNQRAALVICLFNTKISIISVLILIDR